MYLWEASYDKDSRLEIFHVWIFDAIPDFLEKTMIFFFMRHFQSYDEIAVAEFRGQTKSKKIFIYLEIPEYQILLYVREVSYEKDSRLD